AVDYARATNNSLAAAVARSGGRLLALGTVPLPHVDRAVEELRRGVRELGLRGVEIGSQVGGLDLDDAALRPFWAEAEALGAAVFVHPTDGGVGVLRRPGQPLGFGLGMTTDTAIAASALVFGGVLEAFPRLRVGLAHGCGTFPWAYPRLSLGAEIFSGVARGSYDHLVRSLWADSLVFDPAMLPLLLARFGADHVVLGTDHPFVAGQFEEARAFLAQAQHDGVLDAQQARAVWRENGLAFVGGPA
ncbi:MAG: 2-hydroxy-3-carboxy-6-oxo-7-methylocta-2,4-dienoate decarboxylase, partial [Frankiales bacterium]|nr:2-hydroxy-3-carboxy-6-oxo-7-methylocta-2,4-dienoate decarboxylase [Frankiales bacterium]